MAKETAMIELTPEQHEALTQNGSQPIRAIDRVTSVEYVLVHADLYERLAKKWGLAPAVPCITKETSLLGRCLSPFFHMSLDPPDAAPLMNEVMAEDDAKDPYLESYQH
jgi:hypothetical protein